MIRFEMVVKGSTVHTVPRYPVGQPALCGETGPFKVFFSAEGLGDCAQCLTRFESGWNSSTDCGIGERRQAATPAEALAAFTGKLRRLNLHGLSGEDEMEFQTVMWAEQAPDIYSGELCDQHKPQWIGGALGDMDSEGPVGEPDDGSLRLVPETFPAGTRVEIKVPLCPNKDCSLGPEECDCGFDWHGWAEDKYQ